MSEIADLIKVMQEQMQRQEERHQQQEERYQQQEERHQQQEERHRQQLTVMQQQLDEQRKSAGTFASQKQTPPFSSLWFNSWTVEGLFATFQNIRKCKFSVWR